MKYQDLMEVDYTAYDHVTDFAEKLEERRVRNPSIEISSHYEDGTPVVDVNAEGRRLQYIDSYILEGITPETFEERGYDLWVEAFEADFPDVEPLEDFTQTDSLERF